MKKHRQIFFYIFIFVFTFFINFFSVSFCTHKVHETPVNTTRSGQYWSAYLKNTQRKIRKNWKAPAKTMKDVIVSFDIARDGTISNCKTIQSSGRLDIDARAESAVMSTSPVSPLPADFDGKYITIEYIFPIKKQPFDIIISIFRLDGDFMTRCITLFEEEKGEIEQIKENTEKNWANNSDWAPYMKNLEISIKNNWNSPKLGESKRVIVLFTIGRNGDLLDCKIRQSSKDIDADNAALSAIKKTAPFKPLPNKFKGKSVSIEFTFDYNLLNK